MSKAGKFVKKHPWETVAGAAALGLGGPAAMGLLEGSTAASGLASAGAGLFGASDATAALAGDAFMPAALGAEGTGVPSTGSLLGSKFASGGIGNTMRNFGRGAYAANKAGGLLGAHPEPPPSMGQSPIPSIPPSNTVLPSLGGAGAAPPGVDPKVWEAFLRQQQQQQFGANT